MTVQIVGNRDKLGGNRRMRNAYASWDRFGPETQGEIRAKAAEVIGGVDQAPYGPEPAGEA